MSDEHVDVSKQMQSQTLSDSEREELAELVSPLNWTFAKTMEQWPHWYIVRNPEIEEIYKKLFFAIPHGVFETFDFGDGKQHPYQYLYLGDGWKYWRGTENIEQSKIINRAKAIQDVSKSEKTS